MPPEPPVSYHQDVAKIFAYHCNGCHGEAGGLSLRSYTQAMEGGNKGKIIIAGDAENSLLIHFIEGRRGEAHRMPAGGRPLRQARIGTIRRWINEGAKEDFKPEPLRYELKGVKMEPGKITRISCRIPVQAYVTITAIDPTANKILWTESASVKTPKEQNDAAQPGEPLQWDLRPASHWPASVSIHLTLDHTATKPNGVGLTASIALALPGVTR